MFESSSMHTYSALPLSEEKVAIGVNCILNMQIKQALEAIYAELHRIYAELRGYMYSQTAEA
jgi:hypothetical protein